MKATQLSLRTNYTDYKMFLENLFQFYFYLVEFSVK